MLRLITATLVFLTFAGQAAPQSFSCRGGTQPACLDYGAKVCNSFARCVSQNDVCFDQFTCDFRGFVCKSTLNEVVEKHDTLVNDFNDLLKRAKNNEEVVRTMQINATSLTLCVDQADDLEAAKRCLRQFPPGR